MSLTKFVIYHQPRTGSTMLWGILGNHPQILCEREIFHHVYEKGRGYDYTKYTTASEYLETVFHPMIEPKHRAFGFKLQAYQARSNMPKDTSPEGELLDIRDYLRENNYKVIVPYRLHKLEQYISQKVAKAQDIWQRWTLTPDGQKRDDPEFQIMRINVEEADFSGWYNWDKKMQQKIETEIEGMDVLRVTYERVLKDWEGQINRMLAFVNVEQVSGLKAKTKKARERPLWEWIENYEEACMIHDKYATPYEIEYRIEHE